MNPYDAPQISEERKAFSSVLRPRNARVFACIFVPFFIGGLFIPTVEFFQLDVSWGRLPLWYAYVGILAPEYWGIALPIVAAHIAGTIFITGCIERFLTSRAPSNEPRN